MNDQERIELAFDILEDAEVVQQFGDAVWLKVSREAWEEFQNQGGVK